MFTYGDLVIQFFDVGQGDGIYIEFPDKQTNMLVDLGSVKGKTTTGPDILGYFAKNSNILRDQKKLDYLVITHGDQDHYNMVIELLETFKVSVKRWLYGGEQDDYNLGFWTRLQGYLDNKTPFRPMQVPGTWVAQSSTGGVDVRVLAMNCTGPQDTRNAHSKNSDSVVLQLDYSGVKVILAGDATRETEKWILEALKKQNALQNLKSSALKVAHHGSMSSTSPEWIQAVDPEYVFVSADRHGTSDPDNNYMSGYKLPQEATLDIIRKNAKSLFKGCAEHTYVSHFRAKDYEDDISIADLSKKFSEPEGWIMVSTKEAIFTSIVSIGGYSPLSTEAYDQGCQYELRISSSGYITANSTVDDFSKYNKLGVKAI